MLLPANRLRRKLASSEALESIQQYCPPQLVEQLLLQPFSQELPQPQQLLDCAKGVTPATAICGSNLRTIASMASKHFSVSFISCSLLLSVESSPCPWSDGLQESNATHALKMQRAFYCGHLL